MRSAGELEELARQRGDVGVAREQGGERDCSDVQPEKQVFAESPGEFDPRKYLKPAQEAMTKICKQRLEEFGAAGNASKIKRIATLAEMAASYSKGALDPQFA